MMLPGRTPPGCLRTHWAGETLLTLIGTRAVHIENYRSILVYTDTEIRIQCRHYILSVSGKKLKICYYDKDEMKISGRLEVIRFE